MNNNLEQTESEIKLKDEMFQCAIDRGEIDHLHVDQSFNGRYGRSLHRIATNAMSEQLKTKPEEAQLQSIIGMASTLVMEGRTTELFNTIKKSFPEYYL